MFIASSDRKFYWRDFTVILPTVSVGNIGQLATDLIISTLNMERVGYVLHPALLPVIGNNPFADGDSNSCQITTGCEVYESTMDKTVVVQQRAPIIKGRRKEYADWLSNWVKENHFQKIIILSSSFSQFRLDGQISGSPFRILLSPKMEEEAGEVFSKKLGWEKFERRTSSSDASYHQAAGDLDVTENTSLHIPGSGITKMLYEKCLDLPVLVFMMFVSEGDNAHDALAFVDQLNRWLHFHVPKLQKVKAGAHENVGGNKVAWKIPMSWKHVFGSKHDQKLFQ